VLESLPEGDDRLDAVLQADGTTLRLTLAGQPLYETGAGWPKPPQEVLAPGFSTFEARGRSYRALSVSLDDPEVGKLARLEIAADLTRLNARETDRRTRIAAIFAATLVLAGLGTILAADLVLRPLRRLRRATSQVAAERDLSTRVPDHDGPTEIRTLASSFNAMLARLQASAAGRERALHATRRFTADVGHELRTPMTAMAATLSLLGRSDLSDDQRATLAEDAQAEQLRFVALLDGLSALARGEAAPIERKPVDLADTVDQVVVASRGQHPDVDLVAAIPDGALTVVGWEPGLRLICENLVRNAIVHGGRPPRVVVTARSDDGGVTLTVEDNGGGVSEADRERIFEPFIRVGAAERPGSGLGLALVAQQAAGHGATVEVDESPKLGGARFTVRFPVG
jgi:signal transduction histidine kinase